MASPVEDEINRSSTSESVCNGRVPCSPCEADGRRLEAVGYCETCKEYLCETCFKYHRLPTLMRKHVLLDQEQMGDDWHVGEKKTRCDMHPERSIEYHCPTHSFFGCHMCAFRHQETCKDSKHIADIADTFSTSEDVSTFLKRLDNVAAKGKEQEKEAERKPAMIERRTKGCTETIKTFTENIIREVKALESCFIETVGDLKEVDVREAVAIADKCVAIQDESRAMSSEIEVLKSKNKNFDLYIHIAKSKDKLLSFEDDMDVVEHDNCRGTVIFEGNKNLVQILTAPSGFGEFIKSDIFSSVKHITSIDVSSDKDARSCCVRGAVIMQGDKIVITDIENRKVKLVDTRLHEVVSEMVLSNPPRSVTKVSDTTVAIAIEKDKKILIVNTNPTVYVDREICVRAECHGLAYCDGKLIVTYCYKNEAEVMDLQGNVLYVLGYDDDRKSLLSAPVAAAVNHRHRLVYISNRDHHSVECFKLDGTALATYKDCALKKPFQSSVLSTGMVLISAFGSKNIHLISSDCKKIKVILTETDSLTEPMTVNYDEIGHTLYVGDGKYVKVFRVSK